MIPTSSPLFTRREALKTIGAGAALLGLAGVAGRAAAAEAAPSTPQPFALPPLGYAFDALEPHVDARTMEIHHGKHHQGYVNNANAALQALPELRMKSGEELLANPTLVPEGARAAVRNNVGGHLNHSLFWKLLAPGGARAPEGALAAALQREFGSIDGFRKEFADAAMKRFGSGWAWLSISGGRLIVRSTGNQDSPLSEGAAPVIGLDVWEHAYYLHYQNRRADYVAAFWNVLNWTQAEANYVAAMKA